MIRLGATANFAGSGGAIIGTYKDEAMFDHLRETMRGIGVAVINPWYFLRNSPAPNSNFSL